MYSNAGTAGIVGAHESALPHGGNGARLARNPGKPLAKKTAAE